MIWTSNVCLRCKHVMKHFPNQIRYENHVDAMAEYFRYSEEHQRAHEGVYQSLSGRIISRSVTSLASKARLHCSCVGRHSPKTVDNFTQNGFSLFTNLQHASFSNLQKNNSTPKCVFPTAAKWWQIPNPKFR